MGSVKEKVEMVRVGYRFKRTTVRQLRVVMADMEVKNEGKVVERAILEFVARHDDAKGAA